MKSTTLQLTSSEQKLLSKLTLGHSFQRVLGESIMNHLPIFQKEESESDTIHVVIDAKNFCSESGTPSLVTYSTVFAYFNGIKRFFCILSIPTALEVEAVLCSVVFMMRYFEGRKVFLEVVNLPFSYFKQSGTLAEKFGHLPSLEMYLKYMNSGLVSWVENSSFGRYVHSYLNSFTLRVLQRVPVGHFVQLNNFHESTKGFGYKDNFSLECDPLDSGLFIKQAN